jgi:ABC-type uncharacterized transport system substrate-binding protein
LCGCGGGEITQKWRLGIYQGGEYHDYRLHLIGFVRGLESLECLPAGISDEISAADSLYTMWTILSGNVSSQNVQFVEDAYWSADWNDSLRGIYVEEIAARTGAGGDLDMMIAMGTWGGQDLAEALSLCPVIVLSASDPVAAGISAGNEFSGRSNVFAACNPDRYRRRLMTIHRIVQFHSLGLIYENSPEGRIYANLEDFRKAADDLGFNLVERFLPESELAPREAADSIVMIYAEIAPEIDALIFTALECEQPLYFPQLISTLNDLGIPTAGQLGRDQVRLGAMLSITERSPDDIGLFSAEAAKRIMAGDSPGSISQIYEEPLSLYINLATAEKIGYSFPPGIISSADSVYCTIEVGE